MSVTYYASTRVKKLRTMPELIRNETVKGIRRGQHRIVRAAADGFRQRSIGRTIFGKKVSGAYKNIKRHKLVENGGVFRADIFINGLAKIQEQGGRIAPHKITRQGKTWNHPGAKMPSFPFADRAVEQSRGAFKAEIEKGVARVAALVA